MENEPSIESKEVNLAAELKLVCDKFGKEIDISKSSRILHEFGILYRNKSPDKISLIRSAVFFNAVLSRQPLNHKAQEDLEELCSHVLSTAGAEKQDLDDICVETQNEVTKMRRELKEELLRLKLIPVGLPLRQLNIFKMKKAKIVRQIQEKISERYIYIMDKVSMECIHLIGKPPCRFTVVGMGSLARQEITPFSDFEHVIVLEDGVQSRTDYHLTLEYFRWFTVIFQVVIINLRETIIPSVATPFLNDSSISDGDWFFDCNTTRGISFDGMMLHACKFPLGRTQITVEKPFAIELIKPVSEMVKFLQADEDVKNGYNLADILTRTCFVSGDVILYKEFEALAFQVLDCNFESNVFQIQSQLRRDLQTYNATDSLHSLGISARWNIKRVIYRSTTLFVSALGRLHCINKSSCFDIIDELSAKNIIGEKVAKKLSFAIAVACETRLKVYMSKNGQDDFVGDRRFYSNDNKIIQQLCELIGEQSIGDYYLTARKIQYLLSENSFHNEAFLESLPHWKFATFSLLDLHNLVLAEWQRYTPDERTDVHAVVCYYVAWTYVRKENYDEALKIYNKLENFFETNPSAIWTNFMRRKAHCLCELKRYNEGLVYIKKSLSKFSPPSIQNRHVLHAWGYMRALQGDCERHLGHLYSAIKLYSLALINVSYSDSHYRTNLQAKCYYFMAE